VETTDKEVDLFSLGGTLSAFHKKGLSIRVEIVDPIVLKVVENDAENPFFGQSAYYLSRLSIVDDAPVLIEDLYLHAKLFQGIDRYELSGRSISRIAEQQYHLRPTGGKQNYRIGYLKNIKGKHLGVSPVTPILVVKRFLHFPVAENAVFSKLYCCTDRFVFSQNIGDVAYE
jgi:GntR family transcriptional regulator